MYEPGLSVLLPVHSTNYLCETLQSIFNSHPILGSCELILVLDRVEEEKVMGEIPPNTSNFVVRILESSSPGIVAALNLGLSESKYDYIARIDEDDLVHPIRFLKQRKFLESHKEVVAVGSHIKIIDTHGRTIGVKKYPVSDKQIRKSMLRNSPIAHPASMFVKQSVIAIGGYRSGVPEDWDLWLRLSKIGELRNLSSVMISYRQHPGQLSRNSFYKLRSARRRLFLGMYLTEKELIEVDDMQISDSEFRKNLFSQLNSTDITSAYKSLKRIEGFEDSYQSAKEFNLKKLILVIVKYPDFMMLEIIFKIKTSLHLLRYRSEF
jgi:glycosyltransferase involved in cell wall biosynthesis